MGRPREHDDDTRQALLGAAERLIHEHGPEGVSVRSVAEAADTSTRAVYSLFGSKTGLLQALASQLFQLLAARIDALPRTGDPVADLVSASLLGFRRTAIEHPSLYRLVFLRMVPDLPLEGAVSEAGAAAFSRLQALVQRVGEAQGWADAQRGRAAWCVHALTEGLATAELRGGLPPGDPEQLWTEALTALINGFGVGAASS